MSADAAMRPGRYRNAWSECALAQEGMVLLRVTILPHGRHANDGCPRWHWTRNSLDRACALLRATLSTRTDSAKTAICSNRGEHVVIDVAE